MPRRRADAKGADTCKSISATGIGTTAVPAGVVLCFAVVLLALALGHAGPLASNDGNSATAGTCSPHDSTCAAGTQYAAGGRHLSPRVNHLAHLGTEKEVVVGNTTYHPSFGIFPKGCKWRLVTEAHSEDIRYQYWDAAQQVWQDEQPAACHPTGYTAQTLPQGFRFKNDTPRTEVTCDEHACIYQYMYYNNGNWYAIVDGETHIPVWRFSRNQEVIPIHYTDAQKFLNSVKWSLIPGDTIMFDFVYYTHPTAIGHWWEMLGPMYATLKKANFKRPCDQFVLLHLQRHHLLEWVRTMIAVTLGVHMADGLPPVYMQQPVPEGLQQLRAILDGFQPDTWYLFERMAITKDLYTGGIRTFPTTEDAQEFRASVYQRYGLPPPSIRPHIPRLITYQRKRANRRVLNEDELIALLRTYAPLEVVEYNSSSSLYEQLLQMQRTGVYVSVHTSNLANAPLLQPGSAVVELLQRNWHWNGLDTSFLDQTRTMGDIHHYAWRAHFLNQTEYLSPRDKAKVAHWPASECGSEECVEAHTRVDIRVDIAEVKALLDSRLPLVWRGASIYDAHLPWPPAKDVIEDAITPT